MSGSKIEASVAWDGGGVCMSLFLSSLSLSFSLSLCARACVRACVCLSVSMCVCVARAAVGSYRGFLAL